VCASVARCLDLIADSRGPAARRCCGRGQPEVRGFIHSASVPMPPSLGKELRHAEFGHLDPAVVRLNHGSYGAAPRCVLEQQAALRDAQNANPDLFLGPVLGGKMAEARGAVASLMGGDAASYALLDNATTAASTVALHVAARFQSGEYSRGDRIVVTRWMYDSCFKAFHHYCGSLGAVFVIIDLPGPPIASIDEVVAAFATALAKLADPWSGFDDRTGVTTDRFGSLPLHPHERSPIRLACLDHIPSACPYILPLDRIVPLLREVGGVEEIFVDGAHGTTTRSNLRACPSY
jgi:selenocysteine lyase/cysteine desulfurase